MNHAGCSPFGWVSVLVCWSGADLSLLKGNSLSFHPSGWSGTLESSTIPEWKVDLKLSPTPTLHPAPSSDTLMMPKPADIHSTYTQNSHVKQGGGLELR